MSVLTTKSINPGKPEILENFKFQKKISITEMLVSSKVEKKIYIGEEIVIRRIVTNCPIMI